MSCNDNTANIRIFFISTKYFYTFNNNTKHNINYNNYILIYHKPIMIIYEPPGHSPLPPPVKTQ